MVNSDFDGLITKLKDRNIGVYDIRFAWVVCVVLSAILWWMPVLGPAVAGYVCGRKTGSMSRGAIVSTLAGFAIVSVVWCLSQLILGLGGYPGVPANQAAEGMKGLAGAIASYLQIFFIPGTSNLMLSQLGVLIVFGFVGGVLSRQVRREVQYMLSVGAVDGAIRPAARSIGLYAKGKSLGFECFNDCIVNQGMMVNENPESKQSGTKDRKTVSNKTDARHVSTTVQTVTTTVSGETATSDEGQSPFADILQRSERRKNDYEGRK